MKNKPLIDQLEKTHTLDLTQWEALLSQWDDEDRAYAAGVARRLSQQRFGTTIYVRGVVEFSNYCRNDCLYCGIRHSNANAIRYRMTKDQILSCCQDGYQLGFRTFVLQSGEDPWFTTDRMADIVSSIKKRFPDCAVTLSIGEMATQAYQTLFDAGADRYLLRHETADQAHYQKLHPSWQSWNNRMRCLRDLKAIGYQTGCGFMVGSPYQSPHCLAEDMVFISAFHPHMIGIGPFIPHKDTPFAKEPAGSLELTLFLLSLCRIACPDVLLPATTALGTIHPEGREMGVLAGANVIMPNLTPHDVRKNYQLYDHMRSVDIGTNLMQSDLEKRMEAIGYHLSISRGDYHQEGGQAC
ncbi:MAG: [FeFe] hydrogenase H-cluster radical SAM maturase HydE [Sphaerochaeta sp.]|jgi:biotin synthase|nr:[FeFe] hydrogenase H-cluster radical SAM maturase HydE [Sphaerochaeta sp.]